MAYKWGLQQRPRSNEELSRWASAALWLHHAHLFVAAAERRPVLCSVTELWSPRFVTIQWLCSQSNHLLTGMILQVVVPPISWGCPWDPSSLNGPSCLWLVKADDPPKNWLLAFEWIETSWGFCKEFKLSKPNEKEGGPPPTAGMSWKIRING